MTAVLSPVASLVDLTVSFFGDLDEFRTELVRRTAHTRRGPTRHTASDAA
jgi:hypothetical protein